MDVLMLNEKQKEFFKQYIERYDIKREGDGFWKLVEIQMALKTGNSLSALEMLTADDYSSEQLEQGRIAIDDGLPLDIIRTFYRKEKTADEMKKARQDFIFNRENSERQSNQDATVMEMSDMEYLSKYLPAEEKDNKQENMDKLDRLEKVVGILEKRLGEFKDNIEQSCSKMESEYKDNLGKKEEMIDNLQKQINDYKVEKEKWNDREMQYKKEIEGYKSSQRYSQGEINLNEDLAEVIEKTSMRERIIIFLRDKKEKNNKQTLENIIVKGDLSAEQLQVVNEAINNALSIDEIRKIANKKYSVEKMQQLIRFYQNQKKSNVMDKENKKTKEDTEKVSDNRETDEQTLQGLYDGNLEDKYNSYEEQYNSYNEDYTENYSEDYQEEYEEDDE